MNIEEWALKNKVHVSVDGDKFCATLSDFIDLQRSPAGFGSTINKAVAELRKAIKEDEDARKRVITFGAHEIKVHQLWRHKKEGSFHEIMRITTNRAGGIIIVMGNFSGGTGISLRDLVENYTLQESPEAAQCNIRPESEMNVAPQFKVGDMVEYFESDEFFDRYLTVGKLYRVIGLKSGPSSLVKVEGDNDVVEAFARRFKPAPKKVPLDFNDCKMPDGVVLICDHKTDEPNWHKRMTEAIKEDYSKLFHVGKKTLGNTDSDGAEKNVKDIQKFGNPDAWQLICKAWSEQEGWMKSTKAMEVSGGVAIQVSTQQGENVSEAVCFVPGAKIINEDAETRSIR